MHSDWRAFLEAQGATVRDDEVVAFPGAPLAPDCGLADLSYLGLIRLSGEESRTFLQGQVTNDVRQASPEHSQLNSLCSPKGRMLANFRLFERGGDLYLQLPLERLSFVLQRLRLFVLRAKVELSDASDELVRIGLTGDCAQELLPRVPAEPPGSALDDPPLTIIRHPGETSRFEVVGPLDAVRELWEQSLRLARPAAPDHWPLLDIRAGVPNVYTSTADAFVPQMANMQLVDGVSFTKGCYTGQEVVARMQYLGKLKRRMYRARLDTDVPPAPGVELFSSSSVSGQATGRVVDARPVPEGGCELLAVVEIASAEGSGLHLGDEQGPPLHLLDLPYALPETDA